MKFTTKKAFLVFIIILLLILSAFVFRRMVTNRKEMNMIYKRMEFVSYLQKNYMSRSDCHLISCEGTRIYLGTRKGGLVNIERTSVLTLENKMFNQQLVNWDYQITFLNNKTIRQEVSNKRFRSIIYKNDIYKWEFPVN